MGAGFPGAGLLGGSPLSELAWCNSNSILAAGSNAPTYLGTPITCTGADVDPKLVQAALPFNGKFPYLGSILVLSNLYKSNYNGLQATLQQRTAHGLSFLASYTYSHSIDDDSYNIGQFLPQDSTNPALEYASSDFDIKHRFTFSVTYAIPGKKTPGQLLRRVGTQFRCDAADRPALVRQRSVKRTSAGPARIPIAGIFLVTRAISNPATPQFHIASATAILMAFARRPNPGNLYQRQTFHASCQLNLTAFFSNCLACGRRRWIGAPIGAANNQLTTLGCYAQGNSVLIPPALGTFGTSGRNIWRDGGLRNWDLSVTKQFKFQERLTAQFRAEFFNVLNHPNFTNPYGASSGFGVGNEGDPSVTGLFGCGCATPDQAAGNPVLGSGGNRAVQLGLKLIF